MFNKFFVNKNLLHSLKNIHIIRIVAMLIVAILSCRASGAGAMFTAIAAVSIMLSVQLIICSKYDFHESLSENSKNSRLSYLPFSFLFVSFMIYNLCMGRDLFYSLSISLALAALILPRSKNFAAIISYVINKNGYSYSKGLDSCKIILNCNKLTLCDNDFINYSKHISSVCTVYTKYNADILSHSEDYVIGILREFSAILYPNYDILKSFIGNVKNDYDYQFRPICKNGITYAVLNSKNGIRVIASGNTDKIKALCSDYADRNSLSKLSEDKHEIDDSISLMTADNKEVISFAFCDLDVFTDITAINDMIFVGALEICFDLDKKASDLCNEIKVADYCIEICCSSETEADVVKVLKTFGINDFIVTNEHTIIINNNFSEEEQAVSDGNKIIYKGNAYSKIGSAFSFAEIKNNSSDILMKSSAIERNINTFSYSLIITFMLASMLIPNNVMQPYVVVLISCIIEIFSMTALNYYKADKENGIFNIVNTFVISFCALGLFFVGRFFIDVPLTKFDAESVNTARMMLVVFFILTTAFYDLVAVFSEPKKHLKNILVMLASFAVIVLLNVPAFGNLINFSQLSFEAFKLVSLFVSIPILVNALEVIITMRKDNNNGR